MNASLISRKVSATQAAAMLGVAPRTIYRLAATKQLPSLQFGRRLVFREIDVLRFEHERYTGQRPQSDAIRPAVASTAVVGCAAARKHGLV